MSGSVVVKLDNVSKYYKLYNSPKDRLKEALHPFRKKYHKEFFALNNISFELRRGECLGIIGKNGMGKSTLLKIIANVIQPSFGSVQINGSVSALLELGTGFNPEFNGMENIYFYGTILGFRKNEVERRVKEIVDFADIGEFIYQPVKTYSSGMFVRLAFAVQTSLKPDILLIDEVLSVGDIFFQQKCHARIEELLSKGTALILVSHDMQVIQKYANSTILLQQGNLKYFGNPIQAIHKYYQEQYNEDSFNNKLDESFSVNSNFASCSFSENISWPDGNSFLDISKIVYDDSNAVLQQVAVCDADNKSKLSFETGDTINFYYEILFKKVVEIPVGAITIINHSNIIIHGKDTLQYENDIKFDNVKTLDKKTVRFKQSFTLNFAEGMYTFSIGIGKISFNNYDFIGDLNFSLRENMLKGITSISNVGSFEIKAKTSGKKFTFHGLVDVPGSYELLIAKTSE